jgi:hypothetical protein
MSVLKKFGTILNNNTRIRARASHYKQSKKKYDKKIPDVFNPFDKWGNFLSNVKNQGKCGACWAYSTVGSFNDRLCIMTLGQFFDTLSPEQMIVCQGAIPHNNSNDPTIIKEINDEAHSQGACNGNSLYSAMDFIYCFGVTTTRCINEGEFQKYNIKKPEEMTQSDIPNCQYLLGNDYDTCLNKNVASRFYRSIAGYAVDSNVQSIKEEIYKWGPVSTGIQVFDNFVNEYDGIGIYMGPKNKNDTSIGGHAVKIMGWGKENDIEFWWLENSWGVEWGLSGYFKMKINIPECQLEQNVVAMIPDLYGFKLEYLLYNIEIDPANELVRSWFDIDQRTGYKETAIKLIDQGKLKGNLNNFICKYTPDFQKMWVGELSIEDMEAFSLQLNKTYGENSTTGTFLLFWIFFSFLLGILCRKIYRRFYKIK